MMPILRDRAYVTVFSHNQWAFNPPAHFSWWPMRGIWLFMVWSPGFLQLNNLIHMLKRIFLIRASLVLFLASSLVMTSCRRPTVQTASNGQDLPPHAVHITDEGLMRGGKPYFIKGGGGSGSLKELAARGGNSVRTWSTNGLDSILDEAHSLGLTVSAGIWLEDECGSFSYSNPDHCDKQAERVRGEVLQYRDHPALLAWGLGNEVEKDGTNTAYWKQLERLAKIVKELDPHHPTFTAIVNIGKEKVDGLNTHTPSLDFVGINTYEAAFGIRNKIAELGWTRPWILSEWGVRGFWEQPKGPGDAPIEHNSAEKAEMIRSVYQEVISPTAGCLGSYVFVWGWKFEATATWFGIFTHEGETTPAADVLQELWSGTQPANRAPEIRRLRGVPTDPIAPSGFFFAHAAAEDPDNDPLTWHWAVLPEVKDADPDKQAPMPEPMKDVVFKEDAHRVEVQVPAQPGIYRLYVWIKDGKGNAATANMPFEVREKEDPTES